MHTQEEASTLPQAKQFYNEFTYIQLHNNYKMLHIMRDTYDTSIQKA